jgi:hypothetical protein
MQSLKVAPERQEILKLFTQASFNEADCVSSLLSNLQSSTSNPLPQLEQDLEQEIRKTIVSNHELLLVQSKQIVGIEKRSVRISHSIATLRERVLRVKADSIGCFNHIESLTCQLDNVQDTIEALRMTSRIIQLVGKLKTQSLVKGAPVTELIKAATSLREISVIFQESRELETETSQNKYGSLSGINPLDQIFPFVDSTLLQVRHQIEQFLESALEKLNHTDIGQALQACFNLDHSGQGLVYILN